MELAPEFHGQRRHGAVEDLEAMDLGVVGRAERNEQPFPGDARLSVMHVQAALRALAIAADPAAISVSLQDSQAKSGKAEEIPPFGPVTAGARASQERSRGAAGAAP
jgi:hypothetical protein